MSTKRLSRTSIDCSTFEAIRSFLASHGITEPVQQNQIANLAIVGWEVNNDISDDAPSLYWPKWIKKFGKSDEDLDAMRYWHALPDGWEEIDYEAFLAARRVLMAQVIRDGFAKLQ